MSECQEKYKKTFGSMMKGISTTLVIIQQMNKKIARSYFDDIRGWSQQQGTEHQQQILNNMLKRKVTPELLPQIEPAHVKWLSPEHQSSTKKISPFGKFVKDQKGRLRAHKGSGQDGLSPLREKLLSILQQQDQNIRSTNHHHQKNPEIDPRIKFYPPVNTQSQSKLPYQRKVNPLHARVRTIIQEKKVEIPCEKKVEVPCEKKVQVSRNTTAFKKYCDHQRLQLIPRKEQQVASVKISKSSIDNTVKSMNKLEAINPSSNNTRSKVKDKTKSINTDDRKSKKKYSKAKLQKIQKANERFKQTFFKQDILYRQRKKQEKNKMLETFQFSDQDIFSYNHSINNLSKVTPPLQQISVTQKIDNKAMKTALRHKLVVH